MAIVVPGSQYTINVTVQRKESWSPRSWMRDLAPLIGERPINQIAIPGTYDSATHAIEALSRIAPRQDISEWLTYALLLSPGGELAAGAIIAGWAKAQGRPNGITVLPVGPMGP